MLNVIQNSWTCHLCAYMREYIWLRVEMSEIYKNTGIFRWLVPYIFLVVFRWLDTNLGIVFVVWVMEWFSTELWNVIGAHFKQFDWVFDLFFHRSIRQCWSQRRPKAEHCCTDSCRMCHCPPTRCTIHTHAKQKQLTNACKQSTDHLFHLPILINWIRIHICACLHSPLM